MFKSAAVVVNMEHRQAAKSVKNLIIKWSPDNSLGDDTGDLRWILMELSRVLFAVIAFSPTCTISVCRKCDNSWQWTT